MDRWQVDDLLILADALATAELDSFNVRRIMQRLENSELDPIQAADEILRFGNT